jgi:MEDS: MEthanogen/methylotroph, DcmR Sensory domain
MSGDAGPQLIDGDHVVQLYADDDELLSMVAGYLAAALAGDDAVIVIATPAHREAFAAALTEMGADLQRLQGEARLVLLDAAETLSRFMVGDLPDARAFDEVVGGLVRHTAAGGAPVRAYGEMVALLWEEGLVEAAIELEQLWNGLGETTPFALFCAYPQQAMADPTAAPVARVCHLHSHVLAGAPVLDDCDVTRRFARTPHSSWQSRRFVSDALERWDLRELIDGARLAVAELSANAILHAESDFAVGLSRTVEGVRLAVSDRSTAAPRRQPGHPDAVGGRGIILVEAIGRRWGHHLVEGGKVVWVDLDATRPALR